MAVQVWVGEKPEHPNERRAIVALANGLERLEGLYLLLVNFSVGGRTVDLTIIKQDAIFIIELKHCDGMLEGGVNGPWYLTNANNERKQLNPGRSNPYNQVISCYYSLTNFLKEHRNEFLSPHRAKTVKFRSCRRVVVIAPTIKEGSQIDVDWKVEVRGLDELPSFLVTERSEEIQLTDEEMLAIPELLQCTRWHDINELIAGVLPQWHAEPVPDTPPQPDTPPPVPAAMPLLTRGRIAVQTFARHRLALVASLVAMVLLLIGVTFTMTQQPRRADMQPRTPVISATSLPAGGLFAAGVRQSQERCMWTEFQPVGKRWNDSSQSWMSVGVDSTIGELSPQIVVILEKVDYCDDAAITFSWSVRNNSDTTITFPLQSSNITIRDPFGNSYAVANSQSHPRIMMVQPGQQQRGTMVVPGPMNQNAPSLLVRLKDKPFGEASWLVSLEGR